MNKIDFDNLYPKQKNARRKSNQKAYKICVFIFALLMLASASLLLYRYIVLDREYNDLLLVSSGLRGDKEYLSAQLSKYEESYNSISADNQTLKNDLDSLKSDYAASQERVGTLNATQIENNKEISRLKEELEKHNIALPLNVEKSVTEQPTNKVFNIGSSKEAVKSAMGEPNKIETSQKLDFTYTPWRYYNITTWFYGTGYKASSVTFDENDKVIEWDEQNVALKIG